MTYMNDKWKYDLDTMSPSVLAAKLADYINERFGDHAAAFEDAVALNMLGMERVEVE